MEIVLVAGLWLDGSAWDEVVPVLEGLGHRPVALTLPGQGDETRSATLEDQLATLLAALDAAEAPALVVGHSAAATLAWLAADRRPARVAGVAFVGGFPAADGERYADLFEHEGALPFPGWEPFEGPDTADLDATLRQRFEAAAIAVPEGVSKSVVHYVDERRSSVPVILVCPEFSPAQAREWVASGDLAELSAIEHLAYVDIDSGHWPMFTKPRELAEALANATRA